MSSSEVDLEKFQIPLEEIKKATHDFDPLTKIGDGGFGIVYKGQLSDRWQNCTAAIKRHNQNGHQGKKEFYNELELISRFHHENIIPFIGYCDEGNEMIFAFKYAVNGSLDYHLQDRNKSRCITWEQRIKICLGAARGLDYLHSGLGKHYRVIHRDVKSGNILLDENMEAQVCDFGLSKSGSKDQPHSEIHTNVAGTNIYMDPNYHESSTLKKESDVYSFGVVLFEMLSGMPAYWRKNIGDGKPKSLLNLVRRYYENEVEKLIDPHIRDQIHEIQYLDPQIKDNIDISSFYTFIDIAYKCISLDLKKRPTMKEIISRFETALDNHEKNPPLIKCVMGDMRFSYGKPVVAFTIYKHLVHLNSLVDEIGNVFDRLIQILNVAIKKKHTAESMVYLLANVLVLTFLTNLSTEFEYEWNGKLMEYVVMLYGIISDHLKKEFGSLLDLHIQAIITSDPATDSDDLDPNSLYLSTCLTDHLNRLEENFVPPRVIAEIFTQLFSYIDVHLFNSMLLHPECLTYCHYLNMRSSMFTLKKWWKLHATSFGAFEYEVRFSPILGHSFAFIELYTQMVYELGIWPRYEMTSKFHCLSQKHLDKLFDIYEEEYNISYESRDEHMSSLKAWIGRDSNVLDDNETFLLEPRSSEPFDDSGIILKSKVKEYALINTASVFASYPAFRFVFKRV